MGTFYFGPSASNKKWYFRLRSNNNEIILASTEGYNNRQSCISGIDSVKRHAPYDGNYRRFVGSDGKLYFTLVAGNNEPIGKSEGYNSSQGRENGIEACKKEAPSANLIELDGF